jgi:hypothetical protein
VCVAEKGVAGSQQQAFQQPAGDAALYRIAYEQGLRTLEDQRDELNGARNRAGQVMALVASATAFLVGTGMAEAKRDLVFYCLAVLGTIGTAVAFIGLWNVLSPQRKFNLAMDPQTLVDKWIDRQVPGRPSEAELLRALAEVLQGMIDANEEHLAGRWGVRNGYLVVVTAGVLGLVAWGALIWLRG